MKNFGGVGWGDEDRGVEKLQEKRKRTRQIASFMMMIEPKSRARSEKDR